MLTYGPARYVVDGHDGDTIYGPAITNDNFGIVNSYLNWNSINKYMELITMGTLREGLYEALTNYDTPGEPPCYWDKTRQDLLPEASRLKWQVHALQTSPRQFRDIRPVPDLDINFWGDA